MSLNRIQFELGFLTGSSLALGLLAPHPWPVASTVCVLVSLTAVVILSAGVWLEGRELKAKKQSPTFDRSELHAWPPVPECICGAREYMFKHRHVAVGHSAPCIINANKHKDPN